MPRRKQTPSKTTSLEDSVEEVEVKKAKVENGNGVDENTSATKVVSDLSIMIKSFVYYKFIFKLSLVLLYCIKSSI